MSPKTQKNNFRGVKIFAIISSLICLLLLIVEVDKTYQKVINQRQLQGGSIQQKICGKIQSKDGSVVSNDDRDVAKSMQDEINSQTGGNKIEAYLKESSSSNQNELLVMLITAAAPWIVFAVISLLGWFCYCLCCCCDNCCPPCKCCRCAYKQGSKLYFYWPSIGGLIFGVWVLVAACVGLAKASDIEQNWQIVKCSAVSFFDDILNGYPYTTPEFSGMNKFISKLSSFINGIDGFITQSNTVFATKTWQKSDPKAVNDQLTLMKDTSYLPNSGKYSASVSPSGQETPSVFFATGGPYLSAISTMSSMMSGSVKGIDDALQQFQTSGQSIVNQGGDFSKQMKSGLLTVQDLAKQLSDFIDNIDSTTGGTDAIFSNITMILSIYHGISLGMAVLGLAGICALVLFKKRGFRFLLYLVWNIFSILMIIGFLLSLILLPVSYLLMELCEIVNKITTIKSEFTSYDQVIPTDTANKIIVCIKSFSGSDGNIVKSLGLDKQLDPIKDVQNSLNTVTSQSANTGDLDKFNNAVSDLGSNLDTLGSTGNVNGAYDDPSINSGNIGSNPVWLSKCKQNTDLTKPKQVDLSGYVSTYVTHIKNFLKDAVNYAKTAGTQLDAIADPTTGILAGLNCLFIGENLNRIYESLCVAFVPGIYSLAKVMIVISMGMLFGSLMLYCTSLRFSRVKDTDYFFGTKINTNEAGNDNAKQDFAMNPQTNQQ